jgi:hypothetical protein
MLGCGCCYFIKFTFFTLETNVISKSLLQEAQSRSSALKHDCKAFSLEKICFKTQYKKLRFN